MIESFGSMNEIKLTMILSNNRIFRELLRIINKFQMNFGVRAIVGAEIPMLTENYF